VRSVDDALSITLNDNGRILRNIIHGADTVMSHILHFYHLAAADFVNISPAAGVLGGPWDGGYGQQAFGTTTACQFVSLTQTNSLNAGITTELVESYVEALNMRKEAHTMGAIFSGRQPIQNAIVPGGVATIFTQSDIDDFRTRLNNVRSFINKYYIPDVVFVATRTNVGGENWTNYWGVGTAPGMAVSYGEYPDNNGPFSKETDPNAMLISRAVVTYPTGTQTFNSALITEDVNYSFYTSPSGLHPSAGQTTPMADSVLASAIANGPQYSWLKAPRYNGSVAEVGPLARMLATVLMGNTKTVSDTDGGVTSLNSVLGIPASNPYTATDLVTDTIAAANTIAGAALTTANLWSPLGRHAARALECKYVADAMYSWLDSLTLNWATTTTGQGTRDPFTNTVVTGSGYTYVKIPKGTLKGEGLTEAPRGALGHWITIMSKKVANYQCVVPTTWNASPRDSAGNAGAAEQVLVGVPAATGANVNDAIVNIARMLHPYDFCIACAVHVVTPEGKEIAKFKVNG
jgi:hydrogenase large subunit